MFFRNRILEESRKLKGSDSIDDLTEAVKFYAQKKQKWDKEKGKYVKVLKRWCGDADGNPVKGFKVLSSKRKCRKLDADERKAQIKSIKKRLKTNKKLVNKHEKEAIKRQAKRL